MGLFKDKSTFQKFTEKVTDVYKRQPVKLELGGKEYEITEDFLDVRISAKDGFVVGMENNVFTILDTTLTPEPVSYTHLDVYKRQI